MFACFFVTLPIWPSDLPSDPLEEPIWRPCVGTAVLSLRIKSRSNLFSPSLTFVATEVTERLSFHQATPDAREEKLCFPGAPVLSSAIISVCAALALLLSVCTAPFSVSHSCRAITHLYTHISPVASTFCLQFSACVACALGCTHHERCFHICLT